MSLKHIAIISGLVAALGTSAAARESFAQTTPPAPRPVQPAPPADPAKPVGPPQGKPTYPGPKISVGPPSSGAASPTPRPEETASPEAAMFIENAGHDGLVEVDLAKLAQIRSTRADVKAYAQMLMTDHQDANEELMAIAKSKNVKIPSDRTREAEATMIKLDELTGAAFDRAYISTMVQDHTKAVAAFTRATKNADPDVKAFAEKTLPTLKHHLEEAQKLAKGGT